MNYQESEEAEETEEGNEENETVCGILSKFWQEIRNFKAYFNINDCAEAIMLKVFLPANDIISDFLFARNLLKNGDMIIKKWFTFFAYYFIAWPGVMVFLSLCGGKYLSRHCHESFFPFNLSLDQNEGKERLLTCLTLHLTFFL